MWVKRSAYLVDALSVTPEILKSEEYRRGQVSDFRDWQVRLLSNMWPILVRAHRFHSLSGSAGDTNVSRGNGKIERNNTPNAKMDGLNARQIIFTKQNDNYTFTAAKSGRA